MPRVAVVSQVFNLIPELRKEMEEKYPDSYFFEGDYRMQGDELVEFLQGAEVAVIGLERFDGAILDRLPDLKAVSCCSVGADHIDPQAFNDRGVRLGWTPGTNSTSVAELTICLMVGLLRRVYRYNGNLKDGHWPPVRDGFHLKGRTVGIHGCGNVGKEVTKLLKGFGVTILASDRVDYPDFYKEYGVRAVSPEELWAESEMLTIHLPKNTTTLGMYTAEVMDKFRPGILWINTSRGQIVDEDALLARLKDGRIGGAAFDVFALEPVDSPELINHPNFLATPHIGGSALEAKINMGRAGIEGITDNWIPEVGKYPFD
jgi:D-3-phosphoglycerate dehydrogenase